MQKSWKDKKKEKYDQRRKGFKAPFNKNNPNKNNEINLLKMNPRKTIPWGKEEDHQSDIGCVRKITYTRIFLTEEIKRRLRTTSKKLQ
jgi:hypothetical protein